MDQSSLPRASYPCPVCGSTVQNPLYEIKGFSLVTCTGCSLVFVNPRIRNDMIHNIYRNDYFRRRDDGYEDYELTEDLRKKTFERWYRRINRFITSPPGSALDVGCAAGYFLEILTREGWAAEGIELDREMRRRVIRKGFTVYDTPLEEFPVSRSYRLITLFDVLEHLPRIREDVRKLADLLEDGGVLALVTPDFSSFQRRLFGRRWFQYKPREHIYYFSPETLAELLRGAGLRIIHRERSGQYANAAFLSNRLHKYGFRLPARLFDWMVGLLRLSRLSWYTDTGSMFVLAVRESSGHDR